MRNISYARAAFGVIALGVVISVPLIFLGFVEPHDYEPEWRKKTHAMIHSEQISEVQNSTCFACSEEFKSPESNEKMPLHHRMLCEACRKAASSLEENQEPVNALTIKDRRAALERSSE